MPAQERGQCRGFWKERARDRVKVTRPVTRSRRFVATPTPPASAAAADRTASCPRPARPRSAAPRPAAPAAACPRQAPIQVAQQRAAAGDHDAAVVDVGRQLGRDALQRVAHGAGPACRWCRVSASRISASVTVMLLGMPSAMWRPRTSIVDRLVERRRRSDLDLDLLGGPLADQQAVRLLHVAR